MDYLAKPPQRYDHVFQKNSGSREMVEDPQGEYVKFDDMDLYMFEGAELMKQAMARIAALTKLVLEADPWVQSRMHRRARKAETTKDPFHKANHKREEQRSMDWLAGAAHFIPFHRLQGQDRCVKCDIPLPPVHLWSMPACPTCTDEAEASQAKIKGDDRGS